MDGQLLMRGFTLSPGSGQICPITVLPIPHFARYSTCYHSKFYHVHTSYHPMLCYALTSYHSILLFPYFIRWGNTLPKKNPLFWHCPSNLSTYFTLNGPKRRGLFTKSQSRVVIKLARTKSIILLPWFILSIPLFCSHPVDPWGQRKKFLKQRQSIFPI